MSTNQTSFTEKTIINTLLVICLVLGFFCTTLIYLPSKIEGGSQFKHKPPPADNFRGNVALSKTKEDAQKPADTLFTVPPKLLTDVAFWKDIYSKYGSHQVVFHDQKYLSVVYGVLDFTTLDEDISITSSEKERIRREQIEEKRNSINSTLLQLAEVSHPLSREASLIKRLFDGIDEPDKFKNAVGRGVRAQSGQKDKFKQGLKFSGRYMGEIESIFEGEGLPKELTSIIFVESMFNPKAHSSAGARGIWQFMRSTGKIFGLKINSLVDERADPILSSRAAASLLRHDFEILGNWPLAINAYNTGRIRIEQAISQLGTLDITAIVKNFSHPAYGFASRNFYMEFLAALEVAKNHERHFGKIEFDPPLSYETVTTKGQIILPEAAIAGGIPLDDIKELNSSLSQSVLAGKTRLPSGHQLRMPTGKGEQFMSALERKKRKRN